MAMEHDMRRVVVTGLGVVSSIGTGREAFWKALCGMANSGVSQGWIQPEGLPDMKHARTMGRIARFAVAAARLALEDSGLGPERLRADDLGVFLGTNLDDINLLGICRAFIAAGADPATGEPDLARFACLAREILHPFDYLQALSNLPAAHVAIRWEARGINCSYVAHGISGAQAIGEAYLAVRDGIVDVALAGGADSWLTPFGIWRREILGGVPSRPWSLARGHRIKPELGEGAAMLLLEPLKTARSRNARIYGEVCGYATALEAEAFPNPCQGAGLTRSMRAALEQAGLSPGEVDYVSAHGEGSAAGDRIEAGALREVFGAEGLPPLRAIKTTTGHLGAASGAVEAVATLLAIDRQWIPPCPSAAELAPDVECRGLSRHGCAARIRSALNVAFHPLGLSASLVFKAVPKDGRREART
jgi:3-oxoacyl-[acyl-carrier-protein] synthase II